MAKKNSHSKQGDSIRIEFYVRITKPRDVDVRASALREMVAYWVDTGIEPSGVKIDAITWERNGKVKRAEAGTSAIEAARENMLRRFLHAASWNVSATLGGSTGASGTG